MQPDLILTPFGENAAPGTIEPIPETLNPGDPVQQASWNAGFPAVTMTPLAAGGIPPRGQDFNGVLNAISEHVVYMGGGGQYKWNADFADINGYPLGAVVQKTGIDGFWLNTVDGNDTDPDTGGAGWVDAANTTLPYALDTGAANAYVATYVPAPTALRNGMVLRFKASNANTGASTFDPNGLGAKPIVSLAGAALTAGAIPAAGHVWVQYDSSIGAGSWVNLLPTQAVTEMTGAVLPFARNTAPTGWLKANGAAVSRITYSALFSAIGTTFGAGDGSTTFNLPDARAEFIRGWDDGRGIDSGRAFGSNQIGTAHNLDIGPSAAVLGDRVSVTTDPAVGRAGIGMDLGNSADYSANAGYYSVGSANTGGLTNSTDLAWGVMRPRNLALLMCIKF